MTNAESPRHFSGEERPWDHGLGAPTSELPTSVDPWIATLSLWPTFDEHSYRLVARCFGGGRTPEWDSLTSLLLHAGLVGAGSTANTFAFLPEWRPALRRCLVDLGGADAARSSLVAAWLDAPDRHLVAEVAGWASDLASWGAVDAIWRALSEHTNDLPPEALAVYRDLPPEARKARPMLTWASGRAESVLSDGNNDEGEATLRRLLQDSEVLHADWTQRDDVDSAVDGGTIRMLGQRRLPTTRAGESLQAAWRTKQDLDAFISSRSQSGHGPSRAPQAVFRAFSALLALFLDDPQRAVGEARWATLLCDWEPVCALAAAVEGLAESISNNDGPALDPSARAEGVGDDFGVRGLTDVGRALEALTDCNDALHRLDRAEVDRSLSVLSPETAALAGVWSIRAALAAFRTALWGETTLGLKELSAEITLQSPANREQDEPLGRAMLARARVLLLIKAGAFGAASQTADTLPGSLKLLPLARIHLWAGHYEQAINVADGAQFEACLDLGDRSRLRLLQVAAALLDGSCDSELRAAGMAELRRMLENEAFLPIALLPRAARAALMGLYRTEVDAEDVGFQLLIERLQQLNDAAEDGIRPVRLTDREGILLPLLATDKPVPEIARGLHVSVNTVRKQVATLRDKFQADTRAELIRKAISYGALQPKSAVS